MASSEKGASKAGGAPGSFDNFPMTVCGITVTADDTKLIVDDIDEGHKHVTAQMSWWGKVWAAAVEEATKADAHYRKWRARKFLELDADKATKGLPEWKIKAHIESADDFIRYKNALGQAERNVITAKTQFESFSEKARQLQSLGAKAREELLAGRKDTTRSRPSRPRVETHEDETEAPSVSEESDAPKRELSAEEIEEAKNRMRESNTKRGKKST